MSLRRRKQQQDVRVVREFVAMPINPDASFGIGTLIDGNGRTKPLTSGDVVTWTAPPGIDPIIAEGGQLFLVEVFGEADADRAQSELARRTARIREGHADEARRLAEIIIGPRQAEFPHPHDERVEAMASVIWRSWYGVDSRIPATPTLAATTR